MRISSAVFCLKKKKQNHTTTSDCYLYIVVVCYFFFLGPSVPRDLHVLIPSFPTRRSSDLLIEVDEAANHIRELVDPDANIIWGSAFNDNLNGKIRVSVVATGIDSEVDVSAPRSQAFTFPTRTVTAQPVAAPAPAPVAEPASSGTAQAPEAAPGFQAFAPPPVRSVAHTSELLSLMRLS